MRPRLGLVCQRNNNIPFVFDVAEKLGFELIDIHDEGEDPQPAKAALKAHLCLPVFEDPEKAFELLEVWCRENRLDGIFTSREEAVLWTALAAERMGWPNIPPKAAAATRDKFIMREELQKGGCNVPAFLNYRGNQDRAALEKLDYPYVLKPKSAFGSAGVTLVRTDAERDAALQSISDMNREMFDRFSPTHHANGLLVEGYLEGVEYVAECFAINGNCHVVSIGYKGNPTGPYFEETVYLAPAKLDDELRGAITKEACKGMKALGLINGPGHCELRVTSNGTAYILEIGARVGGSGSCHYVVEKSTGFDLFGNQMRFAAGQETDIKEKIPRVNRYASNYIIPIGGYGILANVNGIDAARAHPQCDIIMRFLDNGSEVAPYPEFSGFIGFIFGTHDSYEQGLEQFAWLDQTITPVWETNPSHSRAIREDV
ncbi:MAG: ATP-grasp domain-containing protein [Cohaesibacter sp.]|nr:ATP-grasp domain-containing protein [Cohaesibacter sp.]